MLEAYFADPSAPAQILHDELSRLDAPVWTVDSALSGLAMTEAGRTRETGAWLVRHGSDRRPVLVGLGLLAVAGRPDDVPLIKTIGLLDCFGPAAVRALAAVSSATHDLVWLAERSERWARVKAIEALSQRGGSDAVAWLLRHAVDSEGMSASDALQVAEAVSLADALEDANVEDQVLDQAGRLLLAMATPNDYRVQLSSYSDACRAYLALARHASTMPASMDRLGILVSLTEELITGYAACLDWSPGQRDKVLAELHATVRRAEWQEVLGQALRSPDPLTRRRAEWARTAIAAARNSAPDPRGIQIQVVATDPHRRSDVETRVLIDGRPVIAAAFDKGAPNPPEALLTRGRLHANDEAHEVKLSEAYCSEGCCGALYVTVVRDGNTVVWRDWRGHTSEEAPPEVRFDAARYDAALAKAEADHSWEWPARTLARLLRDQLTAHPDLLARWQCHLEWIMARSHEPGQARLSFSYPERPTYTDKEPWLQFELVIQLNQTSTADQAAYIIEQLETVDPKTLTAVVGGNRDYAEQLGYTWPAST